MTSAWFLHARLARPFLFHANTYLSYTAFCCLLYHRRFTRTVPFLMHIRLVVNTRRGPTRNFLTQVRAHRNLLDLTLSRLNVTPVCYKFTDQSPWLFFLHTELRISTGAWLFSLNSTSYKSSRGPFSGGPKRANLSRWNCGFGRTKIDPRRVQSIPFPFSLLHDFFSPPIIHEILRFLFRDLYDKF